jgi:hypothetical protein
MELSSILVEKLNQGLGIVGKPHVIFTLEGNIDTGCYQWSKTPSLQDVSRAIPPRVAEAFQRLYSTPNLNLGPDPQKSIDGFFAKEPAETRGDYEQYMARVKQAQDTVYPPSPKFDYSPQLQESSKQIEEQLSHENFEKNGFIDLKAYNKRIKELWALQPAEIQAEVEAVAQQMLAYHRQAQKQVRRKRLALDEVRALLTDEPATAYRAGIEWERVPSDGYETIIVAPTTDQWDILRIERTQGNNHPVTTEELIALLKELDQAYGVDITGAAMDGLEFTLRRVPTGKEAREVGRRLYEVCPELGEPPVKFPKGRVNLWWD